MSRQRVQEQQQRSPGHGSPVQPGTNRLYLDKLLSDLRSFLLILDRESLSATARAKKRSVSDLLSRLQSPPSEDAEYMIMRCLSPSPGSPPGRTSPGSRTADAAGGRACECRPSSAPSLHGGNTVPGVPPSPPADDSYEDAEPPGRGRTGGGDSDSSHYESYGEEDEEEEEEEGVTDRAHYLRWPAATGAEAEPPGRPEAQLCGFLWRKRWLGQWAKQLFIVREHVLLCFRCAADLQPVLELDLRGCRVTYKDKRGKKMPHALKVTGTTGEVLVIGFQSRQQAEDWRKVIEEVSSDAPSGLAALSVPASPSSRLSRPAAPQLGKEEEEEEDRSRQSPARSPRPGEDAKGGFLAVRLRGRWQRLWCAVRHGALRMFPEPGAAQRPVCALRLDGCEVSPGAAAGSPQNLRIRIAQRGRELALLQARSDEEREAWLKTLQARGGVEAKKGDGPPPRPPRPSSRPAAGGLLLRRVPTPNTYMDDPFGQPPPAETPKHLYSNAERLQQLQQSLDRAGQGQRRRPVSALPTCASSHAPGSARPLQAAPPAALRGRPASAQLAKDSPNLQSRDFSRSQHTLTLPERKGTRDGLDVLIGRTTEGLWPGAGHCLALTGAAVGLRGARAWQCSCCPCREESLSQAGGEGGAAGESLPGEGQAQSRLRDEPAGPREVTEGPHRRHRQLGWLRGIIPQAAAEAHHVSEERPEAAPIPGHHGEGKCDAEDKGVGDEVCDVTTPLPERESPGEHRAARGSCRTSLDSAWNLTFIHQYQRYNYAHLFFIYRYIDTHTSTLHPWVSSLPPLHPHPSQHLVFGVQNS